MNRSVFVLLAFIETFSLKNKFYLINDDLGLSGLMCFQSYFGFGISVLCVQRHSVCNIFITRLQMCCVFSFFKLLKILFERFLHLQNKPTGSVTAVSLSPTAQS